MRRNLSFCMAVLCLCLFGMPMSILAALNSSISGKIFDDETGLPLNSASVAVVRAADSSVVKGAKSDATGSFEIKGVPVGNYFLKVTYVGMKTKIITPIVISDEKPTVEISRIDLATANLRTEDIEVTAERSPVEFTAGKTVINVDKTLVASGGNALDVLKTSSAVEVSNEGQISVRGSSNVQILIDGKPSQDLGANAVNKLRQIPAGAIARVEISTNPGAKYSAEGMGGIINIITKKDDRAGINGLYSGVVGTSDKYSSSLNLSRVDGRWNTYMSYDFSKDISPIDLVISRSKISNQTVSELIKQTGSQRSITSSHNFKFGVDYDVDKHDLYQIVVGGTTVAQEFGVKLDYRYYDGQNQQTESMLKNTVLDQPHTNYEGGASYKHTFNDPRNTLSFDSYYAYWSISPNTDEIMYRSSPTARYSPVMRNNKWFTKINGGVLQSDYSLPFAKGGKFDCGWKTEMEWLDVFVSSKTKYLSEETWHPDSLTMGDFWNNTNTHALYATYADAWIGFDFELGLRGEYTTSESKDRYAGKNYEQKYFNLFPNVAISYNLSETNALGLSYSRRINRPSVWLQNPLRNNIDEMNVKYGNPALEPEHIDSYELNYMMFIENHKFTPSLFYKHQTDAISGYSTLGEDNVMYITYGNIAKGSYYGFELGYQGPVAQWCNWMVNASYFRSEVDVSLRGANYKNSNYSWNVRSSMNLTFGEGFSGQLFGYYSPEIVTTQGSRDAFYSIDAALRYEFMNRKAFVTLKVADVFNSIEYGGASTDQMFSLNSKYMPKSQIFSLNFTYIINNGWRSQEKKPKSDASPDIQML